MNPWLIQSDPIEIFRWATFSLIPSNKYVIDEKVNVVGVQSNTNVSNNGPNNTLPCCIIIQYIYSKYWKLLQGPCDICLFLFDVFTVWVTSEDFAEKFKKVNCV